MGKMTKDFNRSCVTRLSAWIVLAEAGWTQMEHHYAGALLNSTCLKSLEMMKGGISSKCTI